MRLLLGFLLIQAFSDFIILIDVPHREEIAEAKIFLTLVLRGEFHEVPSINHNLCMQR